MTVAMPSRTSWLSCPPPRFGTPRRPERETLGPAVAAVARRLNLELMPWQQHVVDVAFEIDPATGRLAYREIVLTVPRRSGKSALLLAVLIHRMIAMGSGQVAAFTMQNGLQARMRLRREWKPLLESSAALKDVFDPSMFSGAEALIFRNGSRLEVVAGTSSSGHGATLDLAVVDEAFDQPDDRLEQAFRPAIRTQPNAQLWWVSTAGSPTDLWFRGKVEAARAGADNPTGTAIFEWSAAEDASPADPAVWWGCMPALGYVRANGSGLTEADIAEEWRAMTAGGSEDGFRRAYLNQWVGYANESAIDPIAWQGLLDPASLPLDPLTFAVDVTPDRERASIAVGARRKDGLIHVETVAAQSGTGWVADSVKRLTSSWRCGPLRVLSKEPLGLELDRVGVDVRYVTPGDYAQACAGLYDLVQHAGLRWNGEPDLARRLSVAVAAGRKKAQGEAFTWARKDATDISPLVAVTLAAHGVAAQDLNRPGRFMTL